MCWPQHIPGLLGESSLPRALFRLLETEKDIVRDVVSIEKDVNIWVTSSQRLLLPCKYGKPIVMVKTFQDTIAQGQNEGEMRWGCEHRPWGSWLQRLQGHQSLGPVSEQQVQSKSPEGWRSRGGEGPLGGTLVSSMGQSPLLSSTPTVFIYLEKKQVG